MIVPGSRVRVSDLPMPGHMRTPAYLRGHVGTVERVLGPFENPEALAYGVSAERRSLYRVRFTMAEIWGTQSERPDDTLEAEIYEHWLRPA